jgi:hypothetical protein
MMIIIIVVNLICVLKFKCIILTVDMLSGKMLI